MPDYSEEGDADKVRLKGIMQGPRPNHLIVLCLLLKGTRVVPTYPELVKVVREEEALLDEKYQGSRELMKAYKAEKISAQAVQVEKSAFEEDSEEEMEIGEWSGSPVVQCVA